MEIEQKRYSLSALGLISASQLKSFHFQLKYMSDSNISRLAHVEVLLNSR